MDLQDSSIDKLKSMDLASLSEVELQVKEALVKLKMDIFAEKGKDSSLRRQYRKRVAQIKTLKAQLKKGSK
jgi:ribosomal protein L29